MSSLYFRLAVICLFAARVTEFETQNLVITNETDPAIHCGNVYHFSLLGCSALEISREDGYI
jgi:hypothetical protein